MNSLSPRNGLLYGNLFFALLLGAWHLDQSRQQVGYDRAVGEFAKQATTANDQREAVAAPIVAKQEAAQVHIRTVTKTLIEKVPVYVPSDSCALPGGFRVLHDAAAHGEIPDSTSIADAAPASAQDIASTVASNYGTCHEVAERLSGLQAWVSAQEDLNLAQGVD